MPELSLRRRLLFAVVLLAAVCAGVPALAQAQLGISSFSSSLTSSQAGAHVDLTTSFSLSTMDHGCTAFPNRW